MKDRILNVLKEQERSYTIIELKDILKLESASEIQDLIMVLNELEGALLVYRTNKDKYMAFEYSHLKKGKITVHDKGYGFILMQEEPDIYIDAKSLNGATEGDTVIAEITNKKAGNRFEGRVLRIANRSYGNLVGEYNVINGEGSFICDDKKFKQKVILTKESCENVVDGHKIVVNVIKELDKNTLLGEIITIIGHKNDPGVDIESIIYKHAFSDKFSDEVMKEVELLPNEVSEEEMIGRKDFRNETIFTIDGDDTKDIDDAISIKKLENGNYELGVHIADVSYYVKPGSKIYEEAYERGTSVYLVDRVVPMLPHKLSNGICSLNPAADRLSESCIMEINSKGEVVSHSIYESVIRSRKQMTYTNVNKFLEKNEIVEGYEDFTGDLSLMKELSDVLRKNKIDRGYIDFDTDEAKIIADENGKPIDIVLRDKGVGEKIIEDFMIVANETVASHVFWMNLPFIYRVHGIPKEERVDDFINFINMLGYHVTGKININHSKSMQQILDQLRDKPEFPILTTLMLRTMQKAVYDPENIGHYGLASKIYTHFTSPIRRFPDTTVHHLLRTYLFNKDVSIDTVEYWKNYLPVLTEHASIKEKDAVDCEREVESMKMAEYMMDHIGEEYEGMISGAASFGIFVQLPNMVEGLIKISDIPGDYFIYDERTMSVIGQKTKKMYRIGQKIKVIVKSASKEESFVDFGLVIESANDDEKAKEIKKVE